MVRKSGKYLCFLGSFAFVDFRVQRESSDENLTTSVECFPMRSRVNDSLVRFCVFSSVSSRSRFVMRDQKDLAKGNRVSKACIN